MNPHWQDVYRTALVPGDVVGLFGGPVLALSTCPKSNELVFLSAFKPPLLTHRGHLQYYCRMRRTKETTSDA